MSYKIREVDGYDDEVADTLAELHRLTFLDDSPIPHTDSGEWLGYWWLAYDGKEPIAFAGVVSTIFAFNGGYLKRVGVLPRHRGQGLHQRLTRAREAKAKKQGWATMITDTTDNPSSANNLFRSGYKMYTPKFPWAHENSLYWKKSLQ